MGVCWMTAMLPKMSPPLLMAVDTDNSDHWYAVDVFYFVCDHGEHDNIASVDDAVVYNTFMHLWCVYDPCCQGGTWCTAPLWNWAMHFGVLRLPLLLVSVWLPGSRLFMQPNQLDSLHLKWTQALNHAFSHPHHHGKPRDVSSHVAYNRVTCCYRLYSVFLEPLLGHLLFAYRQAPTGGGQATQLIAESLPYCTRNLTSSVITSVLNFFY